MNVETCLCFIISDPTFSSCMFEASDLVKLIDRQSFQPFSYPPFCSVL